MKLQIIKITLVIAALLGAVFAIYYIIQDAVHEEQNNIGFKTFGRRDIVFDMVLDGDVLYAATSEGILSFDTNTAENNGLLEGLEEISYARAILLDKGGKLWIGHDAGITVYDPGSYETIVLNEKDGLPDSRVTSLCEGESGAIWAGTWSGVACFGNSDKAAVIKQKEGLLEDMVSEIYMDNKGGLWCGSDVSPQGGLSCLYQGKWNHYTIENGLPHNSINEIYPISDSQILVGTGCYDKGGVAAFTYKNDQWQFEKEYGTEDGVIPGKIRSIFKDDSGILWVGYEFQGISLFKDGKSIILTMDEGLPHNEVMKVVQDNQGNYWLATADGAAYINKESLLLYFDKHKE